MKTIIFSFFSIIAYSNLVFAQQPGTLDERFGDSGKVINVREAITYISSGVMRPDNKMIVCGSSEGGFLLQRYTTKGLLDHDFGNAGTAILPIGKVYSFSSSGVALTSDGKIIAVGEANYTYNTGIGFLLARSTADGNLDLSFGNKGLVIDTSNLFGVNDNPSAVVIQADGCIVVTGTRQSIFVNDFSKKIITKRYLPDGNIDYNFGDSGIVITSFNSWDVATSIVLQSDGKIVVGCLADDISPDDDKFGLIRYMPDGSLDETFGNGGKVLTDLGRNGEALNALAIQDDGKILAAGSSNYNALNTYSNMTAVRYNSNGSIDKTFGNNGITNISFAKLRGEIKSVQIQNNEKIILSGRLYNDIKAPQVSDFAISRLLPDGSIDSTFGNNGTTITDIDGFDILNTSALQSDGNIVLLGGLASATPNTILLSRYYGDPVKQPGPIAKRIRRWIRNHTLQWQPVYDNDVSYYSIQQSSNGVSGFKEIGRITNVNRQSSNVNNVYSFSLNNASSSNIQNSTPNTNYYRVTAVSNSGSNVTSDVIADESVSSITVSPNPVKDVMKIAGLPAGVNSTINIISRNGNVLQSAICNNTICNLNVSQLKSGVYTLQVVTNGTTQSVKFIKE